MHSNFNNVKGFQGFFFCWSCSACICLPISNAITGYTGAHTKTANLLVNFAAGANASTKHLNATQWLRFGVTMIIINSTVWWNASTLCPVPSTIHSKRLRGLSMHYIYILRCAVHVIQWKMFFVLFFLSPFLAGFALMRMNKWTIVKPQIRSDVRLHSLRFSRWLSFACFCFHFEFHSYIRLDSPVQQHSHANFDAFDCRWCWSLNWMYILCTLKPARKYIKIVHCPLCIWFMVDGVYSDECELANWYHLDEQKRRHTLHKERTQIGHTFDT